MQITWQQCVIEQIANTQHAHWHFKLLMGFFFLFTRPCVWYSCSFTFYSKTHLFFCMLYQKPILFAKCAHYKNQPQLWKGVVYGPVVGGGGHTWAALAHHTSTAQKSVQGPLVLVVIMCRTLLKTCVRVHACVLRWQPEIKMLKSGETWSVLYLLQQCNGKFKPYCHGSWSGPSVLSFFSFCIHAYS